MSIRITSEDCLRGQLDADQTVFRGGHVGSGRSSTPRISLRFVAPSSTNRILARAGRRRPPRAGCLAARRRRRRAERATRRRPAGRVQIDRVNVLPLPSSLARGSRPARPSAICRLMASPSPVPPNRRVTELSAWRNGSKIVFQLVRRDADARVGDVDHQAFGRPDRAGRRSARRPFP